MPQVDRLLYKPAEAAEVLAISRSTLYELMDAGEVQYIKLGRCRRIRPVVSLYQTFGPSCLKY